jgi:hypothetical protein
VSVFWQTQVCEGQSNANNSYKPLVVGVIDLHPLLMPICCYTIQFNITVTVTVTVHSSGRGLKTPA